MSYLDFFVHPLPALAIIGMAVNDHWLKRLYPSWITGKLSDFLGVFYFPLLVCAGFLLVTNLIVNPLRRCARESRLTRRMMMFAMLLTAVLMIAVKASPEISQLIERLFTKHLFKVKMTPDPTDLIALVSLVASYLFAQKYFGRETSTDRS